MSRKCAFGLLSRAFRVRMCHEIDFNLGIIVDVYQLQQHKGSELKQQT